jgi:hypothetical protein
MTTEACVTERLSDPQQSTSAAPAARAIPTIS